MKEKQIFTQVCLPHARLFFPEPKYFQAAATLAMFNTDYSSVFYCHCHKALKALITIFVKYKDFEFIDTVCGSSLLG